MHKPGKIAVAGGTGRVGRHIVDVLEEREHEVVPILRSLDVDVMTGEGLAEALAGVETVIDAATQPKPDQEAATTFFTTATHNLQAVGEQAGVQRIVVVSIIGIDRFTAGFLAAKRVHEQAMLAGPIPVRILRAAQFHEFVADLLDWGQTRRCQLLADHADAAGRRPHGRRGARRPRHRARLVRMRPGQQRPARRRRGRDRPGRNRPGLRSGPVAAMRGEQSRHLDEVLFAWTLELAHAEPERRFLQRRLAEVGA